MAAFARAWPEECHRLQQTVGRGSFVPLSFAPGEAFQFDWSEDFAVIRGVRVKLQVAHAKLCYSRAFTVRAYLGCRPMRCCSTRITTHFRVLGGVPRRAAAYTTTCAPPWTRSAAARNAASMYSFFGHDPGNITCSKPSSVIHASGWEKGLGREERPGCAAPPLANHAPVRKPGRPERLAGGALPGALGAQTRHGGEPGMMIADVQNGPTKSRASMRVDRLFDGFVEVTKRVSSTCLIPPGT